MNIASVGSSAQQLSSLDSGGGVAGAVAQKVVQQQKLSGEEAEDLIKSATAQPDDGHALSVYA
jgi:hypothetical protein